MSGGIATSLYKGGKSVEIVEHDTHSMPHKVLVSGFYKSKCALICAAVAAADRWVLSIFI